MRSIVTLIVGAVIGAGAAVGAVNTASASGSVPELHGAVRQASLRECAAEDSTDNCYYDARFRGNRKGHPFYVIHTVVRRGGPVEACVVYWNGTAERQFGACYPIK